MKKEQIKVEAIIDNYKDVRNQLVDFLEINEVSLSIIMRFELILEELFVNVCHYAYEDSGMIECICIIDNYILRLELIDEGKPFDPFAKEDPDINAPAEERPIGGLGIYLVKKNSSTYDYSYTDGKNIVKITMDLKN